MDKEEIIKILEKYQSLNLDHYNGIHELHYDQIIDEIVKATSDGTAELMEIAEFFSSRPPTQVQYQIDKYNEMVKKLDLIKSRA